MMSASTNRVMVIAEAGVNHNGSIALAKELIEKAARAGADVVKFQTFSAGSLVTRGAEKAAYQVRSSGGETQYDMLRRLELSADAHGELIEHAAKFGLEFLSTPFDLPSLAVLTDRFHLKRIKLGSGEITNGPLLLAVARTSRPIILSTGMATLDEVEQALGVLAFGYAGGEAQPSAGAFRAAWDDLEKRRTLAQKVVLLHCTTEYPAPYEDVNLYAMDTMRTAFGLPVGYSDHTPGIEIALAAAARGAVIVEKHFTLDRSMPGPDHMASLEPDELTRMVEGIRHVELALGDGVKTPRPSEIKNMAVARKSIVAAVSIAASERLTQDNLTTKRPGSGLSPMLWWDMEGRPAKRNYDRDDLIEP